MNAEFPRVADEEYSEKMKKEKTGVDNSPPPLRQYVTLGATSCLR